MTPLAATGAASNLPLYLLFTGVPVLTAFTVLLRHIRVDIRRRTLTGSRDADRYELPLPYLDRQPLSRPLRHLTSAQTGWVTGLTLDWGDVTKPNTYAMQPVAAVLRRRTGWHAALLAVAPHNRGTTMHSQLTRWSGGPPPDGWELLPYPTRWFDHRQTLLATLGVISPPAAHLRDLAPILIRAVAERASYRDPSWMHSDTWIATWRASWADALTCLLTSVLADLPEAERDEEAVLLALGDPQLARACAAHPTGHPEAHRNLLPGPVAELDPAFTS